MMRTTNDFYKQNDGTHELVHVCVEGVFVLVREWTSIVDCGSSSSFYSRPEEERLQGEKKIEYNSTGAELPWSRMVVDAHTTTHPVSLQNTQRLLVGERTNQNKLLVVSPTPWHSSQVSCFILSLSPLLILLISAWRVLYCTTYI